MSGCPPVTPNFGLFVGQGSVRDEVIGPVNRKATAAELDKMRGLVRQGMEDGAFGLSSGLFYVPGTFTPTAEVIAASTNPAMASRSRVLANSLIALRLTERSIGDELLPETRAGLAYGSMLSREGDYYGPVVNLASRLTEIARPGEVLASRQLTDGIARTAGVRTSRSTTRRIRDIGRVEVIRLTRAG